MEFGERIKEQRNQLGWTQAEVAKKLFVTRQTISSWEKGKTYPDLNTLVKISNVYQISIDSLLKEDAELKKYLNRAKANQAFNISSSFTMILFGLFYYYQASVVKQGVKNPDNLMSVIISLVFIIIVLYQSKQQPFFSGMSKEKYNVSKKSTYRDPWFIIILSIGIAIMVSSMWFNDFIGAIIQGTVLLIFGIIELILNIVLYN